MRTIIVGTILLMPGISLTQATGVAASKKPSPAVKDAELILAWVQGRGGDARFEPKRFGDVGFLRRAGDVVFYTDIPGLAAPKNTRRVTYEALRMRMDALKNGHRVDPLILLAASTREKPPEEGRLKNVDRTIRATPAPGTKPDPLETARYYYVEVGIGNLAWHWLRIAVYEVDGVTYMRVIEASIS